MDPVIFTGRVAAEALKDERPGEYARLDRNGALAHLTVGPPPARLLRLARGVATIAVSLGLIMVGLILYAFLN